MKIYNTKIIFADDQKFVRDTVKDYLCEYNADFARDGKELVERVARDLTNYDVIVSDTNMPILEGPEACRILRDLGYNGFIIGSSGIDSDSVRTRWENVANIFLPKTELFVKLIRLEDLLKTDGSCFLERSG